MPDRERPVMAITSLIRMIRSWFRKLEVYIAVPSSYPGLKNIHASYPDIATNKPVFALINGQQTAP
jgi:hypothetical protein